MSAIPGSMDYQWLANLAHPTRGIPNPESQLGVAILSGHALLTHEDNSSQDCQLEPSVSQPQLG